MKRMRLAIEKGETAWEIDLKMDCDCGGKMCDLHSCSDEKTLRFTCPRCGRKYQIALPKESNR